MTWYDCLSSKFRQNTNTYQLTPQLLKPAVTQGLNALLAPIQAKYRESKEWQEVNLKAYPPAEKPKKEEKVKKMGTGYRGGQETQLSNRTKVAKD